MWRIFGSEMTLFELRKLELLSPDFSQPNWTESPSLDPDECVSFVEAMAETPSCVSDDFWFSINLDDLRVRWKNRSIMILIFFLVFVLRPVKVKLPHYHTIFKNKHRGDLPYTRISWYPSYWIFILSSPWALSDRRLSWGDLRSCHLHVVILICIILFFFHSWVVFDSIYEIIFRWSCLSSIFNYTTTLLLITYVVELFCD